MKYLAAAVVLMYALCWCTLAQGQEVVVNQKSIEAKIKNEINIKIGGQVFPGVVMWRETKDGPKYRIITDKKMAEIAQNEAEQIALAQQCKILCVSDIPTKTSTKATAQPEIKK